MNKQSFYTQFRTSLAGLGCDDELCREWVEAASGYISLIPDSEFDKKYDEFTVEKLISRIIASPDTALDEIFRGVPRNDHTEADYPEPVNEEGYTAENTEQPTEQPAEMKIEDDVSVDGVLDAVFADDPAADKNGFIPEDAEFSQDDLPVYLGDVGLPGGEELGDTQIFDVSDGDDLVIVDRDRLRRVARERKLTERQYIKGSPLFYLLLILFAPVWIPLYIAVWVLVGAVFVAVAALMVAFIAAMVAVIGAGAALSLVDIIYGVVKLFSQMPIGLFEIGLGIVIAGVTMLVSILLYNLAVRLITKLFKPVKLLARFVNDKLIDLYYTIKKECGRK
ncbi:MAG: hypothetical protein IJR90_05550 [Clostridia bacterium]|nr:hypothetical protein [Clostridia bacterium]